MTVDTQALRELVDRPPINLLSDNTGHLILAAADTIDALRDGIEIHNEALLDTQRWLAARERERDVARAEVARLREAIVEMVEDVDTYSNDSKVIRSVSRIARAALGEGTCQHTLDAMSEARGWGLCKTCREPVGVWPDESERDGEGT